MPESPNVSANNVVRLVISSNGQQIDDSYQVVSVSVSKQINRIPFAKIVLLDGDMPDKDFPISNKDDFKPGAEIMINAGYGAQDQTIFQGIIVKHGIKITGDNYSRLVIECRDKAVKMTVGRKNANYTDVKDSDVITKLIGNYSGLSSDVESTQTQYKELVQYYCTDWDFMLSRAEINGLLVTVDEGKVTVKSPQTSGSPTLNVTYGEDLLEFQAEMDARTQFSAAKGTSWDLKTQAVVEGTGSSPTLNSQGDLTASALAQVISLSSLNLQTSAPLESTALKSWADAQLVKSGLARIRGSMKFQGSALAKIGELVAVAGVGNRFNGNVYVSSVRHDISNGNWLTEADFGMPLDWFAENRDIVAPPASGLTPGVEGLHIGVVKKLDADPESEYKIQVSVPILQAETEGVWARLAEFYATADGKGAFFVPEIGDEVILGYFNNDPSHPVILGSLYSSNKKPPYELTADNYKKAIITKGQLKIEFDDEKKILTIVTPANNQIVIDDDQKSILLQDQNNNKVQLNSDGIVLDSPKDIKITATGKISLTATGEIGVTSQADVKVTGLNISQTANVGFTAKGSATAELSASGQTTVKGAMVMIN